MKPLLLTITSLFLFNFSYSQDYATSLQKLVAVIEKKSGFDAEKQERISLLKKSLNKAPDLLSTYTIDLKLYDEYKSFNYNKAFYYSKKLESTGRSLKDPKRIAYGKIKLGFVLLSSGMFKETVDALKTVNINELPDTIKQEYYFLSARTYYDLADFDKDNYYSPRYIKQANNYIDSAVSICKPDSYEYQYYMGLKLLKMGDIDKATLKLQNILDNYSLTYHQLAVTTSTLSDIYIRKNNIDEAIRLLIKAATADIKSSTKEAAAMLNLAQLLHKKGDVKNAYTFINEAMADADYYGARQRKIQVSNYLMLIAGGKVNSVEEQRRILFLYASLLTVLSVIVVVFAVIIYRQLKKLKKADELIIQTNKSLQETINKLNEAEIIKEEYIGYYFNLISEYINKLEKFKRSVDNKLTTRRFDDIQILVNNINLKKEREELFITFDKAFLKIFPNFVACYNSLFDAEHQVKLLPNQLLNTDLRIFALIRLGIHDTEKIAGILEYSMNTIYNYKARIKSKSLVANDDFELEIMKIKAI